MTKKLFLILAALVFTSCSHGHRMQTVDRFAVEDTIVAFGVNADLKDWKTVQSLFTPKVQFLMTAEGEKAEPKEIIREEMTAIWEKTLQPITSVHHQFSNFQIQVHGNEADAKYYGISLQYKPQKNQQNVRAYVGRYELHLMKLDTNWKIAGLKYFNKFVGGNLNLE